MTMYDALMLLIVVVCFFQGAWRGMVWQIAPVASLIGGYLVAYPMSATVAEYFGNPPLNRLWAMLVIYLAVSMAVYLMVRSIRESLERMKLVEFDRHLGALLGGLKGVLFTLALTIGLISISAQAREIILKSESSTIAARIMTVVSPILPTALNDLVRPYVEKLHEHVPATDEFGTPLPQQPTRSRSLAKPKRFLEEIPDVLIPPTRRPASEDEPDDSWNTARNRSRTRPAELTEPSDPPSLEEEARDAARSILNDLFDSDPLAQPGRNSAPIEGPSARTPRRPAVDTARGGSDRSPASRSTRPAPKSAVPTPEDSDDFFNSDPNNAFPPPR
jgi:uncharacterized membrane protein required for colicin V production